MGLKKDSSSLYSETGLKRFSEFFKFYLWVISFQVVLSFIFVISYFNENIFEIVSQIFSSVVFTVIIALIDSIIILWLFWAFIFTVVGRKEIDRQHEINVMIASAFLIPAFILFVLQVILSKGLFVSSSAFYFKPSGDLSSLLVQSDFLIAISIALSIAFAFAFYIYVHRLTNKNERNTMIYAIGLQILSPLTLYVSAIISNFLLSNIYRSLYVKLCEANIKPTDKAPCPFCNQEIPIDSTVCPYCKAKFKDKSDLEIDPRLDLKAPKQEFNVPHGYTPVKGPTEEEKKRLYYAIGAIIVSIIIISVVIVLIS